MNATLLYRIAAGLLVVFAAGHTAGFLKFRPGTPEGRAVHDAMNRVQFPFRAKLYSYGGFYRGFGLFITAYLLFSAVLAWQLGELAGRDPTAIGVLGWTFCVLQLAGLVLSWIYFFPVTVILSALVAVCLGWAAWLVR